MQKIFITTRKNIRTHDDWQGGREHEYEGCDAEISDEHLPGCVIQQRQTNKHNQSEHHKDGGQESRDLELQCNKDRNSFSIYLC